MDLSHGQFYKTIEEAETAIKEYSKEHYFIINRGSSKTVEQYNTMVFIRRGGGATPDE